MGSLEDPNEGRPVHMRGKEETVSFQCQRKKRFSENGVSTQLFKKAVYA